MSTQTLSPAPTTTAVQTYAIDPSHSKVEFKVRHLGFSKVTGRFDSFSGEVKLAPGELETIEAVVSIDAATINTSEPKRDGHLRSGDFFETEQYPQLTFRSTGVRQVSGSRFVLAGELTIRDVTRPIELQAEYLGEAADPWGGRRVAFEATGKLNRKEYGLTWNAALETGGVLVSDEVELFFDVQAVLSQA